MLCYLTLVWSESDTFVQRRSAWFKTRSSATADGPRDALGQTKSCQPSKQVVQQIEVIELEGYNWPTCSKLPRLLDCRIVVVNKLDRRRRRRRVVDNAIDLPWRNSRSLGQSFRGKYPKFWRYPNFLITQWGIDESKVSLNFNLHLATL